MPTGDDSRAMFTATIIMRKLNAINKSPIANFIGNDGSKFFLANCAQIPAKIGANKTTITGLQTEANQLESHILQSINPYSPLQKYLMNQLIDQSLTKKQRLLQKVKIIKLNFFFQKHLVREKKKIYKI
jgi:hypothetical protein